MNLRKLVRSSIGSSVLLGVLAGAAAAQEIRVNCGGSTANDASGAVWSGDQYFSGGDLLYSSDSIANTVDLALYRSARSGLYGDFTYSIPVANGTYNLSLGFAELIYWNRGDRVFNVTVNGTAVLSNFDILAETASRTALVKTFPVTVTNGQIQIAVAGVVRRGILNNIQIVPTGGSAPPPPPSVPAGAPVVSINAGGNSFTGLDGASWTADQNFSGGDVLYSGALISGAQDLALYRSARQGLYGDFSYSIPVANGPYVLKLRFAELVYGAKGQRVFNVIVNGSAVLTNFDILSEVAGLTADDKSFPVTVTNGLIKIDVNGVVGRGILNGIQVLSATSSGGGTTGSPALSLSAAGLSFSATAGGSNPSAQTVNVSNSGTGTLTWTAASSQSWLSVSPASGTGAGAISITPNLSGLSAGNYTATVTVTAAGATGSPAAVNVSFTVAAAPTPPVLTLSTTALTFSAISGGSTPASQSIGISNTGGGVLSWTATKTQPWLYLSATSGTGAAPLSVQAALGTLAAGTYTDTVTIASGTTSKLVAVTFTVAAPAVQPPPVSAGAPVISINCGGSSFVAADGTSWSGDQSFTGGDLLYTGYMISGAQDLALYRSARRGLYGDFSYTLPLPNGSYILKLKFAEIMFGSRGQRVFNVNVNGAPVLTNFDILADVPSLTADDKQFAVNVTNGTLQIDVIGVVGRGLLNGIQVLTNGAASAPSLSVSSTALSFAGTAGAPNPAAQSVNVANSGTGSLNWTAVSNQPWLSVTPTSGSGAGPLLVSANLNGLSAGTYNGAITVSAAEATNSPATISVTLTVVAPVVQPSLSLSTGALSFSGTAGGANPAAKFVSISTGGGTLPWTAASNQPWLAVSTAIGAGDATISTAPNLVGLAAGTYTGTITITAPSAIGSPKTVAVTLTVAAPAPVLTLSTSTLSFSGTSGGANPAAQSISISNTGGGTLSWTAASSQPWLTLSPTSTTLSVAANLSGLAAGIYSATITVTAPGATGSPKAVGVSLTVAAATPVPAITSFTATPNSITVGQSATLSWTTTNATGASITGGPGTVPTSGSISVTPGASTVYTLTATNGSNSASSSVTVTVTTAGSITPPSGSSSNTDQWIPNNNPSQSAGSGQILYNGIQMPAVFPPSRLPSQAPSVPPYITNPPAVIPINIGRQLFVDDFLIAQTNLTRVQHQPTFYPGNPVLAPATQGLDPNNNAFPFSDGVWYDPADHLFKMWYFGAYGNNMCYAYSTDGKNWIKPRIADAVVPNTNIVMTIGGSRDSATVWMDLRDPNPARKFKAFVYYTPTSTPILWIYFSPDGIHWTGPQSNTPLSLSDRTTVFFNPFRNVWVESARQKADLPATASRASYLARARFYSESADLLTWHQPNPQMTYWTGPEDRDPAYPGTTQPPHLYTLDGVAYESLIVGMFNWYYPANGPELVELGVGFSRDGFNWVRPTRGAGPANAFISSTNLPNTWNGYNTQSAGGAFLVVGDQLYFYFSGRNSPHNLESGSTLRQTGLATLRRDGFYSMDAGATEGTLTTRPLTFNGGHLFVNVADPAGQLRVEILDANGNVIPQFSKTNSAVITADKTMQEVTWTGAAIASLAGQSVRLKFYLTNGLLYSFWVTPSAAGASYGYVAAGGPGFTGDTDTIGGTSSGTTPSGATAAPVLSPAGGTFSGSVSLSMTSATAGAIIRYTTNGADPTSGSLVYTGPIALTSSATVKAKAFATGSADSSVTLGLFTLQADSTPPALGSAGPSGSLPYGTTQTNLILRTSESAACRYSTTAGTAYAAMTGAFNSTSDGINQSAAVSGLVSGGVYTYYVRCQDLNGNANPTDLIITFAVNGSASFTPFSQYLEAEAAALTAPMTISTDGLASGGRYISTATGAGDATFTVTVPATGAYYVWGRILSIDGGSDSFTVSADGGPTDVFDTAEQKWSTAWQWTEVNGRGSTGIAQSVNPRIFTLTVGPHTIKFAGRDPNTKLDRILVTNDPSVVPNP